MTVPAGTRPRIAILDDYLHHACALADWRAVERLADITVLDRPLSLDEAADALAPFDIICTLRERQPFPAALIDRLPQLKYICVTGMRYDNVDVAAARARGILVTNTPVAGAGVGGVTELTWGLILSSARHIAVEAQSMREGAWQTRIGTTLRGKQLGVVGLGRIGADVARIGRAFGMDVAAWSPNLTPARAAEHGVTAVSKSALFAQSDVVTLHLPLSETTIGVVGRAEIDAMHSDALLVNTARAGLIDEFALMAALHDRRIGGAALDVYSIEPLPADHALRRLDNVQLTPHLGYFTREMLATYYNYAVENIMAYLDDAPIRVVFTG